MKKGILLLCEGSTDWIGGVYYVRNIAFVLSQNRYISDNYRLVVEYKEDKEQFFTDLPSSIIKVSISEIEYRHKLTRVLKKYGIVIRYNIKYCFPRLVLGDDPLMKFHITPISWVADYQFLKLPEMFTKEEIKLRNEQNEYIADTHFPLVLSSEDSKRDFRKFYKSTNKPVYVVHFVSYIEPEIRKLTADRERLCLNKYGLDMRKYICISNQFWKHKNHIIVLQAMKVLAVRKQLDNFLFVFTGMPKDYRNPEYYEELTDLMADEDIIEHIKVLGFIDRTDQIAILKNAKFIIQPSLFEGWGTVLEDSKVLDKIVLLSDIPVHHEQMNENCIFFDPYDADDLADKVMYADRLQHVDDIEKGIADMHERAVDYSIGFEELLKDF